MYSLQHLQTGVLLQKDSAQNVLDTLVVRLVEDELQSNGNSDACSQHRAEREMMPSYIGNGDLSLMPRSFMIFKNHLCLTTSFCQW